MSQLSPLQSRSRFGLAAFATTALATAVLVATAALVAIGCKPSGPVSSFEVLSETSDSLRAQFNADVGSIRILMLLAPT